MPSRSHTGKKTADTPDPAGDPPASAALAWCAGAAATLLIGAALLSFDPLDPPNPAVGVHNAPVANWVGTIGAHVAFEAKLMLGPGVWVVLAAAVWALIWTAGRKPIGQVELRAIGVVMIALSLATAYGVWVRRFGDASAADPWGPGGLFGGWASGQLGPRFGVLGAGIIVAGLAYCGAVLTADRIALAAPRVMIEGTLRLLDIGKTTAPKLKLRTHAGTAWERLRTARVRTWEGAENDLEDAPAAAEETPAQARRRRRAEARAAEQAKPARGGRKASRKAKLAEEDWAEDAEAELPEAETLADDEDWEYVYEDEDEVDAEDDAEASGDEYEYEEEEADEDADAPAAYVEAKKDAKFDPDELRRKMSQMPVNFAQAQAQADLPELAQDEPDLSGYRFPPMDLLEEPEGGFSAEIEQLVRDQAVLLESAMQQYRIDGEVVGIDSGPVITLFEVRLAPGTKVSKLASVSSDLARSLKAQNIRIVPNMAGKDTVGVEVPNLKKERVRMRELMAASREKTQHMMLPMFLGKDASGQPLVQDLNQMPHMLIAGTTGSGKSVCMNAIILSFLYTRRPDELKLVLVDPKMVEMSLFKHVPHLMCPVVTEMSKAAAILEWAVTKMDERYELLAEVGVRDIAGYNALGWDEVRERMDPQSEGEAARIPKKMPYMVFVIDELADLMMTNKEVEGCIVRIAQKARAVGIHLILATQRPSANVVTGLIKSNMPCRICMKVASGMDSRIVLDAKGGELLMGHGDMLFVGPRSSELIRGQGTLVDEGEIRKAVRFLKEVTGPSFERDLVQIKSADADQLAGRDPMFDRAVEIVIETGRGSVSLLQRRLTVGYGRASRMIEMMESSGILGGHKTAQAREVLISEEEWEAMKAQAEADAAGGYAADAEADPGPATGAQAEHAASDESDDNAWEDAETEEVDAEEAALEDGEDAELVDETDVDEEEAESDDEAEASDDDEWEYVYEEVEDESEEDEDTLAEDGADAVAEDASDADSADDAEAAGGVEGAEAEDDDEHAPAPPRSPGASIRSAMPKGRHGRRGAAA
ncbi:MAG: DNA translocase FtsK 4TM domain-containing protein [Planctomycetota bacterium]